MMVAFVRYSPYARSVINVIIIVLLCLLCKGTPVHSMYFTPHYISPEGGCDSSDDALDDKCSNECRQLGFPAVNTGLPVPMMIHLCVDNICYCSTQNNNNQFAWTKGRVITGYDCELKLPAELEKEYEYQHCFIQCTNFGYKQESIDKFDSTIPDIALIFNLLVDNDCCCAGKPQFSEDWYELPDDDEVKTDESEEFGSEDEDLEISEEQDFSTVVGDSQGDMINGFGEFGSSGGFQYSSSGNGVQEFGSSGRQPTTAENGKRKRIDTPWYPGKDLYKDEDPEKDPVRESSRSAAKRAKRDEDDQPLDEGESSIIAQTPDADG